MAATPIPPHLIYTVFQYILPPSLPMPSHLLSKPLSKRHHFLGISPTDSASYLCWPSSDVAHVAEALEFPGQEGLMSPPEHHVRYSVPDQESLFAHVRPHSMSPLQIVFAWDVETKSWRYHDARMLPFPTGSLSSLDVALAQRLPNFEGQEILSNKFNEMTRATRSSSPTSDNYWAGYDSSGSSPRASIPTTNGAEESEKAEAAYWASYGAVHGSGDSTVPSPRGEKMGVQMEGDSRGPNIPTDPLITHLHLRLHEHNGLLSPRLHSRLDPEDPYLSVKTEETEPVESTVVIGEQEIGDLKIIRSYHSDIPSSVDETHAPEPPITEKSNDNREADDGVKDAVRGIYRMWKAHRSLKDVGIFMELVKSAVETS